MDIHKYIRQLLPIIWLALSGYCFMGCKGLKQKKLRTSVTKIINNNPVFEEYFFGFELYDLSLHKEIMAINNHKHFTPASNTKLFTFYACLNLLGDSLIAYRFKEYYDSLIIWGMADPTFLHPDILQNDHNFNFLKNYPGKLIFSNSHFHNTRFGPGWAWDDYNDDYAQEISPFPIYGNMVVFEGRRNNNLTINPAIFVDSTTVLYTMERHGKTIYRSEYRNHFIVDGFEMKTDSSKIEKVPIRMDWYSTRNLLADTLHRRVEINYLPLDPTSEFAFSIPIDSVLKPMLQESDNFLAEHLLLQCGVVLTDSINQKSAIAAIKKQLFDNSPDELLWRDGSGLSRYNLFTPATIVSLLKNIYMKMDETRLFSLLPAGGINGTIKDWYFNEEKSKPYIFAKTGTLSNNHCLSGYLITKTGSRLIFSFMHNNYPYNSGVTKLAMIPVLEYIRDHY